MPLFFIISGYFCNGKVNLKKKWNEKNIKSGYVLENYRNAEVYTSTKKSRMINNL